MLRDRSRPAGYQSVPPRVLHCYRRLRYNSLPRRLVNSERAIRRAQACSFDDPVKCGQLGRRNFLPQQAKRHAANREQLQTRRVFRHGRGALDDEGIVQKPMGIAVRPELKLERGHGRGRRDWSEIYGRDGG